MNPYNPYAPQISRAQLATDSSAFLRKVYAYMAGGLLATAVTATVVASSETLVRAILGNPIVFYGLIIGELGMVLAFSALVNRISAAAAGALFFAYAIVNGLTLSVIFLATPRRPSAAPSSSPRARSVRSAPTVTPPSGIYPGSVASR